MNDLSLKSPSAFLPLVMSIAALCLVVGHAAIFGIVHETDEGTAAHVFQLLMVLQTPLIAFFAIKWLPRAPGPALKILSMQLFAALAAVVSVGFLT